MNISFPIHPWGQGALERPAGDGIEPPGYPALGIPTRDQGPSSVGQDAIADQFAKQHYAGLQSLLTRQIRDAGVAADMLNEAVAISISHLRLGRVSAPDRLPGYVYRVALNLYRNYRRELQNRADIRAKAEDLEALPAESTAASFDAADGELVRQVRKLIEELPTPRDREVIKRFYLDEEEKATICESLGLSSLHFDKVVFRARQRMRSLFETKGLNRRDYLPVLLLCAIVCGWVGPMFYCGAIDERNDDLMTEASSDRQRQDFSDDDGWTQ